MNMNIALNTELALYSGYSAEFRAEYSASYVFANTVLNTALNTEPAM